VSEVLIIAVGMEPIRKAMMVNRKLESERDWSSGLSIIGISPGERLADAASWLGFPVFDPLENVSLAVWDRVFEERPLSLLKLRDALSGIEAGIKNYLVDKKMTPAISAFIVDRALHEGLDSFLASGISALDPTRGSRIQVWTDPDDVFSAMCSLILPFVIRRIFDASPSRQLEIETCIVSSATGSESGNTTFALSADALNSMAWTPLEKLGNHGSAYLESCGAFIQRILRIMPLHHDRIRQLSAEDEFGIGLVMPIDDIGSPRDTACIEIAIPLEDNGKYSLTSKSKDATNNPGLPGMDEGSMDSRIDSLAGLLGLAQAAQTHALPAEELSNAFSRALTTNNLGDIYQFGRMLMVSPDSNPDEVSHIASTIHRRLEAEHSRRACQASLDSAPDEDKSGRMVIVIPRNQPRSDLDFDQRIVRSSLCRTSSVTLKVDRVTIRKIGKGSPQPSDLMDQILNSNQ
jgi:hypothetical protein